MPSKHALHVALTDPLIQFVTDQVATGEYASNSEVIRAALRLMIERKGALAQGSSKQDRDHLRG